MKSIRCLLFSIAEIRPWTGPALRERPSLCLIMLLVISCLMPVASHAKHSDKKGECTAANARPISIAEASRGGSRQEWACVRITGIVAFWTMYGSVSDIYQSTETWQNHNPRARRRARMGLGVFPAADDGTEFGWPWSAGAPHRITLLGRLHECGRDPETGKPYEGFFMELNWCHVWTALLVKGFEGMR
ncbi:hypothetical protein [Rhizorhabdus dicambivorans]|uniref:hypothetical protein n=1 Tax=Rhizorhabdus dicambivorans TaxID=1850238 RepID=UPI0011444056|nr:hypothetical protein [Rhizorhabdus dicambivorans]